MLVMLVVLCHFVLNKQINKCYLQVAPKTEPLPALRVKTVTGNSQDSVASRLRCDDIFNDDFIRLRSAISNVQ